MKRFARWASVAFLVVCGLQLVGSQEGKYSVKIVDQPPPKELSEAIQKVLQSKAIQLVDGSGQTVAELWARNEVPAEATAEQIKNGLTYRELKQTELVAAIRFPQDFRDYRKQKVKAGVYTLRLAFQPMDGDHTGASEFQDFLVVLAAGRDPKAESMEPKHMIEVSGQSIGTGHPAVFMLFPNNKPGAAPEIAAKPKNHWVVNFKEDVAVKGKKTGTALGFGLTLVGAAD